MARSLSSASNLDALRREAKRWLQRLVAGDPAALERFREVLSDHKVVPKLRQVQHALAREYGFSSWAALKQELDDRARSSAERVCLFLEKSVNRYGTDPATRKWGDYERDGPGRGDVAARLLNRHPQIARDSIHTAVAAHDLGAVQAYNTSLGPDSTFWLDLLWSESAKRGETHKWTGPAPSELGGGKIPNALAYLLGNAVPHHILRTRWLLEHGADARGLNWQSRQAVIKHAVLAGREDVAELLIRHGAIRPELSEWEQFLVATQVGDLARVGALAREQPAFLNDPAAMFAAIRMRRTDIVEFLLDLGMSVDVGDPQNFRALHVAAHAGALPIARLLIARGAEIDPFELRYGGTPLTHAVYHGQTDMVQLLVPHSRNFRGLCYAGAVERLRELLSEEPDRANREDRPGEPALFCLPDDEDRALEIAELLLSFGANPRFRNPRRETPAQVARSRGLDEAALLLDDAA